jgi:hypothetical protein
MKPMASFDPSQLDILHDRFTDQIETWTDEDADGYRQNAMVETDGTVEWRGSVFDGWGMSWAVTARPRECRIRRLVARRRH